jgi:hypothetical protein
VSRPLVAEAHSNGREPGARSGRPGRVRKTSAEKSAGGVPFQPGQDVRRGRGPAKGAPLAGRPPEEFRQALRDLASRADIIQRLAKILSSPKTSDSDFLAAHKYVAERGYGKVPTVIEGGDQRKPLVIRLVREGKQ